MNLEKYNELSELVQFNEKENNIYIPNEIFDDLTNCNEFKATNDISFAYSYIYLITWLYRYTKYADSVENIDQRKLKEILGYSPTNQKINYLIKNNGLLEQLGYLKTTTDYPISWSFEDGLYDNDNLIGVTFETYHDYKDDSHMYEILNRGRNFHVKCPVKAFHRNDANELDGTFYNVEKTHHVPFEVFLYCMSNKEIGTIGFYLWSYLKMNNQKFNTSFNASLGRLQRELKIKGRTLNKYMAGLKKYRMIKFWHNQDFFAPNLEKEDRKPNSYIANDYVLFSDKPVDYEKIKFVTEEQYEKLKEEEEKKQKEEMQKIIERQRVDISEEQLPF